MILFSSYLAYSCPAGEQHPATVFIFSFMFLFLAIQMVGVTAMATCQEKFGPTAGTESSRVPMKLNMNTVTLKRQNVRNPVERDTNFWNFVLFKRLI